MRGKIALGLLLFIKSVYVQCVPVTFFWSFREFDSAFKKYECRVVVSVEQRRFLHNYNWLFLNIDYDGEEEG